MPSPPAHQPQPSQRPGLILSVLGFCLRAVGILFASLLISIAVEWIGLWKFWPEQGWHHSHDMMLRELGWLSTHFKTSLLVEQPARATAHALDQLHDWILVRSGFGGFEHQTTLMSQEESFTGELARIYIDLKDYLMAALYTTFTFVVRLMVLTLSTPLFLLAAITGAVDGLMRRDLRKFGAGRESSFVYHRARRTLVPLLLTPWIIYLSLPWSLNPLWVLLPCAGMLGLMVAITASTFKKYL